MRYRAMAASALRSAGLVCDSLSAQTPVRARSTSVVDFGGDLPKSDRICVVSSVLSANKGFDILTSVVVASDRRFVSVGCLCAS